MATLNVNVGVLGHVDSGKTSLGAPPPCCHALLPPKACMLDGCSPLLLAVLLVLACPFMHPFLPFILIEVAALSTTLSTAALDKHPQSRERGITLDLGFSALTVGDRLAVA